LSLITFAIKNDVYLIVGCVMFFNFYYIYACKDSEKIINTKSEMFYLNKRTPLLKGCSGV